MSLKQSIVVVNEYTIKSGNGGSRGGSPGDYVLRYMARNLATEDLTPVRFDNEDYIMRYMARKEATDTCESVSELKTDMKNIQGLGGVAFGYGDISLSHKKLKAASKDIQNNFDEGKTVMKTVLSFDEAYLKENHIVDEDFEFEKKGDYRGNIDQMRLRMAIMNGMDRLGRHYDDLQYVGVIQVDTAHVHCHLAMVDRGHGRLAADGTQKGKISERGKRDIRRGIDMFLDDKQCVRMMTSNITHDKRNALCFIKKYTHKTMDMNGLPQFLLASLPDDKRMWRANTNRKEMQKANELVKDFVTRVLEEPDSGYREAMQSVDKYARARQNREGLSTDDYYKLVRNGQERIVDDCMNGVYSVLKKIPDSQRQVRTPMMDIMAAEYEDVHSEVQNDPTIEFGFKLRSYSSRLNHHKKEKSKYHDAVKTYESMSDKADESKPLYDFFREEEEYNAMLMCKYQYFLSFLPPDEEYEDDFNELLEYEESMNNLEKMKNDDSLHRMSSDNAEDYGLRVYGVRGGKYATFAPDVLTNRLDEMKHTYQTMQDDFSYKLADYGLTLDEKGVSTKKPYVFDDVKSLDLHHLTYDWTYDVPISKRNVDNFVKVANVRYQSFTNAKNYLVTSGQEDAAKNLPEKDIMIMKEMADQLAVNPVMITNKPSGGKIKPRNTVRLDVNYDVEFNTMVKATLQSLQLS